MAVNKPIGDNARKGAVRKSRSPAFASSTILFAIISWLGRRDRPVEVLPGPFRMRAP